MKKIKNGLQAFSLFIILSFISFACATSYQSTGFTGGYSETQLDENVFQVNFKGNGFTSKERSADFALLRCAELASNNGYDYFTIIDAQQYTTNSTYTTPTQTKAKVSVYGNTAYGSSTTYGGQTYNISKPSNTNTIICFKEKPEGFSYNVKFLMHSLKEKYDLLETSEK